MSLLQRFVKGYNLLVEVVPVSRDFMLAGRFELVAKEEQAVAGFVEFVD
jgi:hypothetical protein